MVELNTNALPTKVITDFSGRLTRIQNGDLNSGYAKFATSFGYDPFSNPRNLTWLEQPTSIASGVVTDLVLDAQIHNEQGQTYVYAIGNAGKFYRIQPNSPSNANLDSVVGVTSIVANSPTFDFGASLEFFGSVEKAYISSDNQINSASIAGNFGTGDAVVGSSSFYKTSTYKPLRQLFGKLLFGNGNTIGAISATNTVTSSVIGTGQGNLYSEINPPLPVQTIVKDVDTTQEGNYALLTASTVQSEAVATFPLNDVINAAGSDGFLFKWNGTDTGITSFATIPSYAVTALQTYLDKNYFFSNDSFGSALSDGSNKILTLENNKPPLPNATLMNGNFVVWMTTEVDPSDNLLKGSMYYFGSLDQENPPGLYRVLRYAAAAAGGYVYQVPVNILTNNKYRTVNATASSIISVGYGKHYFSTVEEVIPGGVTNHLLKFLITSSGTGVPQSGVYETQTELFTKKVAVKQARVYTTPTATGNAFQLDFIGSDGTAITPDNGVCTYSYAAGTDETLLQGSLERINFNPEMRATYALGLRIKNTGTTNMRILKIELDLIETGK